MPFITESKEAELRLAYKLLALLSPPAMEAAVLKELIEASEKQDIPIETLLGLELTPNQEFRIKQYDDLAVSRYKALDTTPLIAIDGTDKKTFVKKPRNLYPY